MSNAPKPNATLMELLRCPICVRSQDTDAQPLTIAHDGWWVICEQGGHKYPVDAIAGAPDMRPSVGAKWKDTATDALPVPPPPATED